VIDRDDAAAWIRLLETPGVGRESARRLLAAFGSPAAVLAASPAARRQVVEATVAEALGSASVDVEARVAAALAWLEAAAPEARNVVPLDDPRYPPALLQTADPPLLLYAQGRCELLQAGSLAIVGSRNPTPQGRENATAFAAHLSRAGLTIISGRALGIDGAAHAGALEAGGATVAVIGTGPDLVYPRKHRELAARIAQYGAVVSEFPLGTTALPAHFPQRNRLIAGLALGTLVIEASLQSGSLITARLAGETGREVFALPGSIHSPLSRGCHKLIRDGARLTETAREVIEALAPGAQALGAQLRQRLEAGPAGESESLAPTRSDDPDYASLLAALGETPLGLDELTARTGLKPAELSSMLLLLELEGAVAPAVNGRWQRLFASSA
jgi:DNA processing protein